MNRRNRVVLASTALVLLALVFAGPVAAKATKTPFKGTWEVTGFDMDGADRIWFPGGPENGQQARRWPLEVQLQTGNPLVDGEWVMLYDNHLDAEGGAGPWNGTFHGDVVCAPGESGSWDGTFTGECWGFFAGKGGTASYRGHGSGCVAGMKISFEKYNLANQSLGIEGYIHDPHGD